MPLPLLLLLGAAGEVISPDDLVLFAKSAGVVLSAQLPTWQEFVGLAFFTIGASVFLLVPLLAVMFGREKVIPILKRRQGRAICPKRISGGGVSLGLGLYLGWQGFSGLRML